MKFEGVFPAIVTPFTRDDKVDEEGLRSNIDWLIEGGVSGVVPAGTTGESATLSYDEHKRVIEITVDHVNGRVPVIAGAGSNSTKEALELGKHAEDVGADAVMMITPYYNKPQQHGLYLHYSTLAERIDLPIIVYNVPSRTAINIEVDTLARLSEEHSNIVGIKEASPDLDRVSRILSQTRLFVLSGNDYLTLPIIALGGSGVISVAANVVPREMAEMVRAALEGNFSKAREIHYKLYPLFKALFIETNPVPVKTALSMMGRPAGHPRPPLAPMKEENRRKLEEVLRKLGLI